MTIRKPYPNSTMVRSRPDDSA